MIINTGMVENYYIAKVYRQHNSMVVVVPGVVCIGLGLKVGNHVVFTWEMKEGVIKFSKFVPVGAQNGRDSTNTNKQDQGG